MAELHEPFEHGKLMCVWRYTDGNLVRHAVITHVPGKPVPFFVGISLCHLGEGPRKRWQGGATSVERRCLAKLRPCVRCERKLAADG